MTKRKEVEIWKDVVGFEGRYQVSNIGNVRSLRFRGHKKVSLMKPSVNYAGYLVIGLGPDRKQYRVHRLVLEAFVGPCPEGMEGCHNDGNRANSVLGNLRWDTPSGNASDRRDYSGDQNPNAKLSEKDVKEIVSRRNAGEMLKTIASDFGITLTRVSQLARAKEAA